MAVAAPRLADVPIVQLRVARLCLDCEELFVGDRCPVCASERFAFLSTWLPTEERRRRRRPAPASAPSAAGLVARIRQVLMRLFGDDAHSSSAGPLRTRATDRAQPLDFDAAPEDATGTSAVPSRPSTEPR